MSMSNLSLIGLYSFDSSIFDGLEVPEGMDKATAVNTIVLKNAELEVLYPDTDFLKNAISLWSDTQQVVWEKLYKTTTIEYNPIWNKDGSIVEVETIKNIKDSKGYENEQNKGTSNRQQDSENDNDLKVAGFNSSELVDREAQHQEGNASEDVEAENKRSNIFANKDNEDVTRNYSRTEQGNIGVTTTQQMLREEREISQFSMYDFIAMDFKSRFCLMVY